MHRETEWERLIKKLENKSNARYFTRHALPNPCSILCPHSADGIREVFKKSKFKFKMAFAMRGGGLEGVSSATYLF